MKCRGRMAASWGPWIALLFLVATAGIAAADETWGPPEPTYSIEGSTIRVTDGGKSQGDHYLLSARDLGACVLEFDMVRVSERKPRERAIVVFQVDAADRGNRNGFWLSGFNPPVGRPTHFRLAVLGDRAVLYRDGAPTGASPQPAGHPKSPGRVGFLHYYDYDYRYENVKLVSLEGTALPQAGDLKGELLGSGAVRLSWTVPSLFQDLIRFQVHRSDGPECAVDVKTSIGECDATTFVDVRTRAGRRHVYRVCAIGPDGAAGPPSEPAQVEVTRVEPPAAPIEFRAIRRLDGSARVTWRLSPESRAEGMDLFASERPITLQALGEAQRVAEGAPAADGSRLVALPGARYYAIRIGDPDGTSPAFVCKEAAPTAPPVQVDRAFPDKHPYLDLTREDVLAVRQKIEKEDWAKQAFRSRLSSADAALKKGFTMPPISEKWQAHTAVTSTLRSIGQTYALSGDEKYAVFVKTVILAYADLYPKLSTKNYRSRVTPYSLMEAIWYESLILAYDYIYDSPSLSAQEKAHIETDLLRPACALFKVDDYAHDPRGTDLHFKCYNFQAWFIGCTGLTGLCLRDADLLEYAIDGPYGFKHLVTHDIRDDGIFWERSLGYHSFVLSALQPLLEATHHCNLDLYRLLVPDDFTKDRESSANYVVDGDNGPKSVKLMYDAPFYFAFPDLSYPVYADSSRGPLASSDSYRIAWLRYHDPKYAWLLCRKPPAPPSQWRGPSDAGASLWLSWDDANLYVLAEVTDDVVRNTQTDPAKWWSGDGVWFALKFTPGPETAYDFIYFMDPGDFAKAKPVLALFNRYTVPHNGPSLGRLKVTKTQDGYEARAIIPLAEIAPAPGETGPALKPAEDMKIAFDACLYDGDLTSGESIKEKMLGWSSASDRYDTKEGGLLAFGGAPPAGTGEQRALVAPKRPKPLSLDAAADAWKAGATPAVIGGPKRIMYDNPSGPASPSLLYDSPSPADGRFNIGTGRFANTGAAMEGSTLFPSSGFAILRGDEKDTDATCVALSFGPHGGGHGHSDMLSIVLYAFGRHLIPDFGSCPYESTEKAQWTAHTVSHNTVVVDEISQQPTGERDVQWPCDSAEKQVKGALDFFHAGPILKVVRAHSSTAYEGVDLVRTVVLLDRSLLDVYDVAGEKEHTLDYVLHVDGAGPETPLALKPQEGTLGARCGYQWLTNVRRAAADGPVNLAFRSKDADALTVTLLPSPGTEIILADGITNSTDKKMPTVIARRKAKAATFVAIASPWKRTMQTPGLRAEKDGSGTFLCDDGYRKTRLFLPEGMGGPAQAGGGPAQLSPREVTWGKFTCVAVAGALREEQGALKADLVRATRCALGGVSLEFSGPASVFASASESVEIRTGLNSDAKVTIKGIPVEKAAVREVSSADQKSDVPCSRTTDGISFTMKSLTRYEIRW